MSGWRSSEVAPGGARQARVHSLLRSSGEGCLPCEPEAVAWGCPTPAGVSWKQQL